MDGSELRQARTLARLSQEEAAERLGVSLRTLGTWERVGVPAGKVALVEREFRDQFAQIARGYRTPVAGTPDGARPDPRALSDGELIAELARRLSERTASRPAASGTVVATGSIGGPTPLRPVQDVDVTQFADAAQERNPGKTPPGQSEESDT